MFGGVASVDWKSVRGVAVADSRAFLFSLSNAAQRACKLKSKAGREAHAVYHASGWMTCFGCVGSDLHMGDECNTKLYSGSNGGGHYNSSYEIDRASNAGLHDVVYDDTFFADDYPFLVAEMMGAYDDARVCRV